jgi:uncharacterized protein with PIN domain
VVMDASAWIGMDEDETDKEKAIEAVEG